MLKNERSRDRDRSFTSFSPSLKLVTEFERKNPILLGLASRALPSVVPGIVLSYSSFALSADFERLDLSNDRDHVRTIWSSSESTTRFVNSLST